MPRVENRGDNVARWCEQTDNGSSTHDLCERCAGDGDLDSVLPTYHTGEPVGEWGGNVEHPPYENDDYTCFLCDKSLTEWDN